MGLLRLGFHFGGVPPRLVEVAGVRRSRKPLFGACGSATASRPASRDFPQFRVYARTPWVQESWDSILAGLSCVWWKWQASV